MPAGSNLQPDILWRMLPWLAIVAISMTVLSSAPAVQVASHHGTGASSHGCSNHDHDHMSHGGSNMQQ